MKDADALATIREWGAAGRYFLEPHARERAEERGVKPRDVRHALANAAAVAWQTDHQRWKVESTDLDGDALTLAVVIEATLIVVTVF